jgi:hypothetical protein
MANPKLNDSNVSDLIAIQIESNYQTSDKLQDVASAAMRELQGGWQEGGRSSGDIMRHPSN